MNAGIALEVWRRGPEGWSQQSYGPGADIELGLAVTLAVDEIYRGVVLGAA